VACALLLLCAAASVAAAQTSPRPQRPFRGLFGGGGSRDPQAPRSSVALLLDYNSTYDEHLAPAGEGGGASADPSTAPAGMINEVEATLRFERVSQVSNFGLDVGGYFRHYGSDPSETTTGGSLNANASRNYGRNNRNNIRFSQSVRYDPVYVGNGVSLITPVDFVGEIPVDPTGLYFRDSWTSDTSLGWSSQMTRDDRLALSYGFTLQDYPDDAGGDAKRHNISAVYDHEFSRTFSLLTNYQFAKADVELNARFARPLWEQFITVGPQYTKRLSPTRQVRFGAGFGGTYVKEQDQFTGVERTNWSPTGQANAGIDLGRDWSLGGSYARSVTYLTGLVRQSLLLDSVEISLQGLPAERVEFSSTFGYSNQASGLNDLAAALGQDFTSMNFGTRARIALTRTLALTVGYSYYDYDFGANANLVEGVPQQFSRNVGAVGLTVWLPLYGRTMAAARP
jgi:hypothetical protein